MLTKRAALLFALIFAFSALAGDQPAMTITPSTGPTTGGTEVTIKGSFGFASYEVYFGEVAAVSTTRVDSTTLRATTPAHLPGTVPISIFEYDLFLATPLTFTFVGGVPEETYARILLPVFVPPIQGAFGSEFRTELTATTTGGNATLYGISRSDCEEWEGCEAGVVTLPAPSGRNPVIVPNGTPGRFVYVPENQVAVLQMSLRALDVSRLTTNYGTSLPVVNFDRDARTQIVFVDVPSDPRFRNTLRLYSDRPIRAVVTIGTAQQVVQLEEGENVFEPSYAQFTNFPAGIGAMRVKVEAEVSGNPPAHTGRIWALLTVTNNETQVITALWPQP